MTTRSRSHVLEEESRRAFRMAIPAEWVVQDQNPDYGLDIQVQIFKNEKATPYFFYAQIKGTDSLISESDIPSHRFSTEHLLHYVSCPFPVMLVIYSSQTKQMYYEWVQNIYNRLSPDELRKWHAQETVTIHLSHLLDDINSSVLEKEIQHRCFHLGQHQESVQEFTIQLTLNLPEEKSSSIRKEIVHWLAGDITTSIVRLRDDDLSDGKILVHEDLSVVEISCEDRTGLISLVLSDGKLVEHELLTALQLSTAMIFSAAGLSDRAIDLVARIVMETEPLPPVACFLLTDPSLGVLYAHAKRAGEAMMLAEEVFKRGYVAPALNFAFSICRQDTDSRLYGQQYRRFLLTALQSDVLDQINKARFHYNLANSLCRDYFHRQAVSHFIKAARIDQKYLQRSYWWAEMGGSLFLLNKFKWSERCYRKAVALGETRIPARALLADSLLHQGRFSEGIEELEIFFQEAKQPDARAILMHWVAQLLFGRFGDAVVRQSEKALQLTDQALLIQNNLESMRVLEDAIKADPLCGLAWFNHVVCQQQENRDDAYIEWFVTAILQEWDIEAWANLVVTLLPQKEDHLVDLKACVFAEAFRLHGMSLENEIARRIQVQNGTPDEEAMRIVNGAKEISLMFAQEPEPLARIILTDDKSEEV